jgi:hypothetical protein
MCSISRPFSARQAKKLAVQTARRVDTKDPTEPCVNREAMPQSVQKSARNPTRRTGDRAMSWLDPSIGGSASDAHAVIPSRSHATRYSRPRESPSTWHRSCHCLSHTKEKTVNGQ